MKRLVYGALFLALVGIVFVGCQKEEVNKSQEKPETTDNYTTKIAGGGTKYYKWYDRGGNNYGCEDTPENCHEVTNIYSSLLSVVDDIGDDADNGDYDKVVELLKENYDGFAHFIPREVIDDVIKQKTTLNIRGRIATDGIAYMLFSKKGEKGKLFSVYPVSK